MATNPALYAPHAPRTQSSPQVLSEDEARVLLTSCSLPSEKCRLMSALVLGLRQGEVLGLQWADMDLDSTIPTVRVERTLRRETGRGLITGPPKTQKSRRILRLPPELVSYLRVHRTHQMKYLLSIGVPMTGCSHVFATGFGTPMDPANDRKTWLSMLDRAGLRRVRLHAARHTCATLMINGGTDIAVVSSVLGHSTIATTADIYGHVAGATAGEALRKISGQVTA